MIECRVRHRVSRRQAYCGRVSNLRMVSPACAHTYAHRRPWASPRGPSQAPPHTLTKPSTDAARPFHGRAFVYTVSRVHADPPCTPSAHTYTHLRRVIDVPPFRSLSNTNPQTTHTHTYSHSNRGDVFRSLPKFVYSLPRVSVHEALGACTPSLSVSLSLSLVTDVSIVCLVPRSRVVSFLETKDALLLDTRSPSVCVVWVVCVCVSVCVCVCVCVRVR